MKTNVKMIKMIPFRLGLAAILFFAVQSRAWAHAFLDHAEPKVGGTVTNSPTEIKAWFTQELEPAFSSIQVQNAQGREVDKKDTHLDKKNKSLLIVSVPALTNGTYTVIWHVTSVDTHRTQGHFQFTVKMQTNGQMEMNTSVDSAIKSYPARGVVEKIAPDLRTATIHNENIPGYMDEMTMDFNVKNTSELKGISPGDQITFKVMVGANDDEWIQDIKRTGRTMPVMTNSMPSMGGSGMGN